MDRQTLEVDVHRDRSGYWAQVPTLEGCFASGRSLDELLEVLHDAIATHLGEPDPARVLMRVRAISLEVEPDLRSPMADRVPPTQGPRRRRAHCDDD